MTLKGKNNAKRTIIGIDFGTAYTYIVACKEVAGKLVEFKGLYQGVGNAEHGIRTFIRKNDKGIWQIGDVAYNAAWKKYEDEAKAPRALEEKPKLDLINVKNKLLEYANRMSQRSDDEDGFADYVDASATKSLETAFPYGEVFFKELFRELIKSPQGNFLKDETDVEFVIGTPPGYGKTYAEELKKCVKNGFLIAHAANNGILEDALRSKKKLDYKLSMRSACYPEPILAGYAWLDKNVNDKGLENGEECLVVDIGAGTVDFAFLERINGIICAKKFDDSPDNPRRIICWGTPGEATSNRAKFIAGDAQDKAIVENYKDSLGIDIDIKEACEIKEVLHRTMSEIDSFEEYQEWKDGKRRARLTITKDGSGKKFYTYLGEHPTDLERGEPLPRKNSSDVCFDDFFDEKKYKGKLYDIFEAIADEIIEYLDGDDQRDGYVIKKCKKILFVGGSSNIDKLKEIVLEKLSEVGHNFDKCDLIELAKGQKDLLQIPVTHSNAVAVGACLAYNRPELITTPSLRLYISTSTGSYAMHTLINKHGQTTGPIVFTTESLESNDIRFFFREGGDLKFKDGESVTDLDCDITYSKSVGKAEVITMNGKELVDTGERWPAIGTAGIGIKTDIKKAGVSLIIVPSKHGNDINKSFVYFLQKLKTPIKVDGKEQLKLRMLDDQVTKYNHEKGNARDVEFNFEIKNPTTKSEKDYAASNFYKREEEDVYYYACYKIGGAKQILDSVFEQYENDPDAIKGTDLYQYIKIFNGNWNDEN